MVLELTFENRGPALYKLYNDFTLETRCALYY